MNNNQLDATFKSLLSLDDMVLIKITNYLNVRDLVNLGTTCKRFAYLTQNHFEKNSSVRWRKNRNAIKLYESGNIFKHIGKYLQAINLAFWCDFEFHKILVILSTECSHLISVTLDSIRMNSFSICVSTAAPMFSKLKQFVLKECYWTGWCPLEIFFGKNSTLEQLSIIDCSANYQLQLKEFRALKELHLVECRNLLSSTDLQRCLENNNISILSLTGVCNVNLFEQCFMNRCDSIESLTFDYNGRVNYDELLRLTKIKKLSLLSKVPNNVDDLITKVNRDIEELKVKNIFITKTVMEALKQFTRLRHLKLEKCSNLVADEFFIILPKVLPNLQHFVYTYSVVKDCDVIQMLKLMKNLRHFSLFGCNNLATDTFVEIVKILTEDSQRPKLKFIPPQLQSLQCLNITENFKRVLY